MKHCCSQLINGLIGKIARAKDVNAKLTLARYLGNLLWSNNIGIYSLPAVEQHIIEQFDDATRANPFAVPNRDCLHVITEPYGTGGHTRLMERLAQMHPGPVDLLVSRQSSPDVLARLRPIFDTIHSEQPASMDDRVVHLASIFKKYQRIIMHIHPDDIVSVVAAGIAKRQKKTRIFFVNHADHEFSYGSYVTDVHFELSVFGHELDKQRQLNAKRSFLGIPVQGKQLNNTIGKRCKDGGITIFSGGAAHKYKPKGQLSLPRVVDRLLREFPSCNIVVIGPNIRKDYWWWRCKLVHFQRLNLVTLLPFEQYMKLVDDADFYLDSHPVPGGTAFVENYLNGNVCIGLISDFQGYTPLEEIKQASIEGLISSIRKGGEPISPQLHAKIVHVHGFDQVKKRYLDAIYENKVHPNLLLQYLGWQGNLAINQQLQITYIPPLSCFHSSSISGRDMITILGWLIRSASALACIRLFSQVVGSYLGVPRTHAVE